jgi:uncharacterized protein
VPTGAQHAVKEILAYTRRVAIVGLSDDPWRASYGVAEALLDEGYDIVPVNPTINEVLGMRAYPSLSSVPGAVDLVDVFRRAEHIPAIARETVKIGARALWLQSGLYSAEARGIAEKAGIDFVENLCLKIEVARHPLVTDRSLSVPFPSRSA